MVKFMINLHENYAFLDNGTKTIFKLQSTRTKGQSILHVRYLLGDNLAYIVTANLGLEKSVGDTLRS